MTRRSVSYTKVASEAWVEHLIRPLLSFETFQIVCIGEMKSTTFFQTEFQNYSLFKAKSIQLKILGLRPTPRWKGLYTVWPVGLLVEHGVGPEDVLLQGWEQGDPEGGPAAGVGCCVDSEGGQLRGQEKGAEAEGVPLRGWEKQGMELPLTQEQGTGLMLEHTEKVEIY
ncbi:hypothetical protein HPB47_018572 [Ixodes persulcatus]|uniref:Uncharacterized protein n=1 Tax=Ixodes persulcatus TaxID=34615 RepID=A0AC60QKJ3_IXOPE|nr:hypothetical protein HPB47_018572 [Ixodes persulcatus]